MMDGSVGVGCCCWILLPDFRGEKLDDDAVKRIIRRRHRRREDASDDQLFVHGRDAVHDGWAYAPDK